MSTCPKKMLHKNHQLELRPQAGPQEQFACCSADVAVYGGAAGGGKTISLLLEPLYHIDNPNFGAVLFRRTHPEITNEGGIWDESMKVYPLVGAIPKVGDLSWEFPSGASVSFGHIQHEKDVLKWHSAQIALIEFDELTTFTEYQFLYMLSRNRSTCGVRPYIRAGCNPDVASWVALWVEWFIDPITGLPILDRCGKLRWFIRDGDHIRWADSAKELIEKYPNADDDEDHVPLSFTFIPAKLSDNKILAEKDPRYRAAMMALPRVERERLLYGNWLISAAAGEWPADYFGRHLYFAGWPTQRECCTIAWDPSKGSDAKFGDFSAFTVLVRDGEGNLYADASGSQRWPVEEGIDHLIELCQQWNPDGVAIEANQFQSLIVSMLRSRCKALGRMVPPVAPVNNYVKKQVRIRRLGPDLANRILRLKGDSPGARILAEQLMTFPEGDHDDFPDSLEMAKRLMVSLVNEKVKKDAQKAGKKW